MTDIISMSENDGRQQEQDEHEQFLDLLERSKKEAKTESEKVTKHFDSLFRTLYQQTRT